MTTGMRILRGGAVALAVVAAAAAWALPQSPAPAEADVSDFSYRSWDVAYEIDTDAEGRAVAQVTETLVAEFPDFDQNRGIVRGLPEEYEGSSTDPANFSVTDASGAAVPFEIEEEDGFVAVLTGDDRFVRGVQTYVISYTLQDVVLAREDGAADEFYWDLVDFEHEQPIDRFDATISFGPGLADRVTGDARCYAGSAGSTDACDMSAAAGGTGFAISGVALGPQEGVTAAIGLEADSVVQPDSRLPNFALDTLPLIIGGGALGTAGVAAGSAFRLRSRRKAGRGTIVAQYDVPDTLPPLLAGPVAGAAGKTSAAQIVHLAVRGAIRIEDGEPEQGMFGPKVAQPVLRLVDPTRTADPLDDQALHALFPKATPGDAFALPKSDEGFGQRMQKLEAAGVAAEKERGYVEKVHSRNARLWGWISIGLVAVLGGFTVASLATRENALPAIFIIMGVVALIAAFASVVKQRVYTPLGAETREYLLGVREFITVAEADRLRMLQSHSGAERRSEAGVDIVHLYERLLPYAMIFGLEKEWTRVLQVTFEQHNGYVPLWYAGLGTAGASSFTDTISQFTDSLSSSVSYTSSSSGGSTGGGFAGGGGGGGFSGGR
ncbi:DUF2207 domain-containing protein [Leucobacter sp. USCH14]|uniref:DUF2207 domain-containing protein n=1 Tax=Leucobacter sp. USCH14 TaxID=3024838 RepID=UPI00309560B3